MIQPSGRDKKRLAYAGAGQKDRETSMNQSSDGLSKVINCYHR